MARHLSFSCTLCKFHSDKEDNYKGLGFEGGGREIKVMDPKVVDHHICIQCIAAIHAIREAEIPAIATTAPNTPIPHPGPFRIHESNS